MAGSRRGYGEDLHSSLPCHRSTGPPRASLYAYLLRRHRRQDRPPSMAGHRAACRATNPTTPVVMAKPSRRPGDWATYLVRGTENQAVAEATGSCSRICQTFSVSARPSCSIKAYWSRTRGVRFFTWSRRRFPSDAVGLSQCEVLEPHSPPWYSGVDPLGSPWIAVRRHCGRPLGGGETRMQTGSQPCCLR